MQLLWMLQHVFHNDPCLLDICSSIGWEAGFHVWLYRLIQYDYCPLYTLNDASALTYIDRRHILGTVGIPNCRLTSTKQPISVQGHSTAACQQPNQCNSPNPCLHAESLMSEFLMLLAVMIDQASRYTLSRVQDARGHTTSSGAILCTAPRTAPSIYPLNPSSLASEIIANCLPL